MDYLFPDRYFGVELEARSCMGPRAVAKLVSKEGGSVRIRDGYEHSHNNFDWVVKGDASCATGGKRWGIELCSPKMKGLDSLNTLRKVLKNFSGWALRNKTFMVNNKCGFHVHVDCSDFQGSDLRKLVRLYLKFEDILFKLVSGDRCISCYCRPWGPERWSRFENVRNSHSIVNRYAAVFGYDGNSFFRPIRHMGLNLAWFVSEARVEFRMHHGTWDPDEVENWVRLCVGLVEAARKMRSVSLRKSGSIQDLFQVLGWRKNSPITGSFVDFYDKRCDKLRSACLEEEVVMMSTWDFRGSMPSNFFGRFNSSTALTAMSQQELLGLSSTPPKVRKPRHKKPSLQRINSSENQSSDIRSFLAAVGRETGGTPTQTPPIVTLPYSVAQLYEDSLFSSLGSGVASDVPPSEEEE